MGKRMRFMVDTQMDKKADLAGPGIGNYEALEKMLPDDYEPLLDVQQTQQALNDVKNFIEKGLGKELNLFRVECPLIVDKESGFNDMLDRDGSRTPVDFHIKNDHDKHPIDAQVVQAVTKWKRWALQEFKCAYGQGIFTDMRAVRKDYFLDHDHSAYVDQWDWERVIKTEDRNLDFLKGVVTKIWKVIAGSHRMALKKYPALNTTKYPEIPKKLKFIHAEDILKMWPELPRKQRETELVKKYGAVFIIGIGWTLDDGYPHEMRAADYDDWVTPTTDKGKPYHGLNGDILVWNPVTKRRHELTSMGIRVTPETLKIQLDKCNLNHYMKYPYHQMILNNKIPLSIGGGIGQSRTYQYVLRKAALGECSVTVWPKVLREMCAKKKIHLLE
jgi:aspartate--ammonia ligase